MKARPRPAPPPAKVRHQDLELCLRTAGADGTQTSGEVASPTIAQIVAIDRGDDDVTQPHALDGFSEQFRLSLVDRLRPAMGHIAERATSGADIAENHEGRGAMIEALAQVRALRLFADGRESVLAQQPLDSGNPATVRPNGRLGANPGRLARYLIEPLDLDRMRATLSKPR